MPIHYLKHPHTTNTSTHTNIIPSQFAVQWISRLCLQHQSNWLLSKALLSIFPVSVFFIVISRYFPWWLACCRWESEILCLDNELTPSSYFSAKHSINHSDAISSIPTLCVHVFNRLEADASSLKKSDLQDSDLHSTGDNPLIEIWFWIEKNEKVREEDKTQIERELRLVRLLKWVGWIINSSLGSVCCVNLTACSCSWGTNPRHENCLVEPEPDWHSTLLRFSGSAWIWMILCAVCQLSW